MPLSCNKCSTFILHKAETIELSAYSGQSIQIKFLFYDNVYIQIYGIDRVTLVGTSGEFLFSGLPDIVRRAQPVYDKESWKTKYLTPMNRDYNKAGITSLWNSSAIRFDNDFSEWIKKIK